MTTCSQITRDGDARTTTKNENPAAAGWPAFDKTTHPFRRTVEGPIITAADVRSQSAEPIATFPWRSVAFKSKAIPIWRYQPLPSLHEHPQMDTQLLGSSGVC